VKSVFTQILALTLLSGAFLVGCGEKESTEATGEVKVQIPWQSEDHNYGLKMVTLEGITNLSRVSGQYAKFYLAPKVSGGVLRGVEPNAQFVKTEEGFVPTNTITLYMATIYAHLQKLAALDAELGAGNINKWPRPVGLGVRMAGGMQNNAFYDGKTDSLLVVPYSDQNLPIAVNAGILAHEHFHSLFYKIVIEPLEKTSAAALLVGSLAHEAEFQALVKDEEARVNPDSKTKVSATEHQLYHLVLTRGMNEGLADFWAWVYTGDPDFISLSLPRAEKMRTLRYPGLPLPTQENLLNDISRVQGLAYTDQHLLALGYATGTRISRVLKGYTEVYARVQKKDSLHARQDVARMIIQALPEMKQNLLQAANKKNFTTAADLFLEITKQNPSLSAEEQDYIDQKTTTSFPAANELLMLPRRNSIVNK
jgi:hypothetical protein